MRFEINLHNMHVQESRSPYQDSEFYSQPELWKYGKIVGFHLWIQ